MRKTLTLATACTLGVLALGLATATPAFAQDAKEQTISRDLAKPLKAAQEAMQAKDWSTAMAKLQEAEAKSGKSAFDQHTINEMKGFVYVRQGNYAGAAKALEPGLTSGFLPKEDVAGRVNALAQVNYQIKNYDKAIEYGNRAVKGGFADEDMYTLVAQAYYVKGDYKGAAAFVENHVKALARRGQTPKEQTLQLMLSSCIKLEDDECTTRALERLVANYPSPEYWQNIIYSLFRAPDSNDRILLNTYRLANEVDALKRGEDYTEMAQLAIEQGSPGEAVAILEKGFEKNAFADQREKDKNQRLLDSARKQAQADKAALANIEAEAARGKAGEADVGVGKGYLSYGQFDKAAVAIKRGIGKGGLRNAEEATLLLGIAQLKAGDKAEAIKTFQSLKGETGYGRLGSLWALHAK